MIEKFNASKLFLMPTLVGAMTAGTSVVAFAADAGNSTIDLPQIHITTQMLQPLVEGIVSMWSCRLALLSWG